MNSFEKSTVFRDADVWMQATHDTLSSAGVSRRLGSITKQLLTNLEKSKVVAVDADGEVTLPKSKNSEGATYIIPTTLDMPPDLNIEFRYRNRRTGTICERVIIGDVADERTSVNGFCGYSHVIPGLTYIVLPPLDGTKVNAECSRAKILGHELTHDWQTKHKTELPYFNFNDDSSIRVCKETEAYATSFVIADESVDGALKVIVDKNSTRSNDLITQLRSYPTLLDISDTELELITDMKSKSDLISEVSRRVFNYDTTAGELPEPAHVDAFIRHGLIPRPVY